MILSRPDRVGDVIIATACLPVIRQQRPDERLVFVAREVMRPLLEGHPLLDAFIGLPAAGVAALAAALRAERATALAHLHPDKQTQLAGWRAGIPSRIGYRSSLFLDWTLTQPHADRRHTGRRHEAEYNFDLLAPLGIQPPSVAALRPQIHLAERWRESSRGKLAPGSRYIVLNPTAHSRTHRWPAENFAWLAHELRAHCDRLVLVGECADDPSVLAVRSLAGDLSSQIVDLAGALNLGELAWLLRGALLLVSRNTGTTHLAAAVGCPVVELFGRLEPAYGATRWRSLGDRVQAVSTPLLAQQRRESRREFWQRGYASIPRDAVLAAALHSLSAKNS